jgi:glutamate synthase domain-containing protein 3
MKTINADGIYYKLLNSQIKEVLASGEAELRLENIAGQRYIGCGISGDKKILIDGVPGNDLAAYMDGLELTVLSSTQDATANTMNDGRIIIHGSSGDTLGYAMRGGEIFVRDSVGYRVGIHMKEYNEKRPVIVVGGRAGDFFGEYMAGGMMIVLGLNRRENEKIVGSYCGTGMHGGVIYVRGSVEPHKLGKEVAVTEVCNDEYEEIKRYVRRYCEYFGADEKEILKTPFIKLYPYNKRPYGNLYAY